MLSIHAHRRFSRHLIPAGHCGEMMVESIDPLLTRYDQVVFHGRDLLSSERGNDGNDANRNDGNDGTVEKTLRPSPSYCLSNANYALVALLYLYLTFHFHLC